MAKILIADDTRASREMLAKLLKKEHHLLEAADGAEALALTRNERPDLVITDILMPVIDGYEFVRTMRTEPAIAPIPVIFYTANYLEADAQSLAEAGGVFRVVAKPAQWEVMLQAIQEAISAPTPPQIILPPQLIRQGTFATSHR